jgi:hypothetical protein
MHTYWSSLVAETPPGLALVAATVLAGLAPYALMKATRRGRARTSLAYLLGLAVGLLVTVFLAAIVSPYRDAGSIIGPGLLGAFFGPFIGMLRAKWEGPARKRRSPPWMGTASR